MTVQTFTASGPFVVPAGVTAIDAKIIGAGGGGGYHASSQAGGGGGGERRVITALAVTPGETLDIIVGTAGNGRLVAAGTGSGTAGNISTLKRGATLLGQANGGGGGGSASDGAGGTGGTGGTGTNGVAGSSGNGGASGDGVAGGAIPVGTGGVPGGGGCGGYGVDTLPGRAGGRGEVVITYTSPPTPLDSLTYSMAIGAINFLHSGRTSLDPIDYALTIGDVVFGRRTELASLSYALTISDIGFSTSGGVVPLPPTNVVLPNRSPQTRSLPATWASLRFRNFDTTPTRTQKLELLREKVVAGANRTIMLSLTDGLPTADPAEPLLRLLLLEAMTIGTIVATSGNAATGTVAFRFFKNGVANGTVSFTGTTGTASGIGNYAAGDRFEVYPPTTADPTLDDVSISIPVTLG